MPVQTRKATAQDLELKLRTALRELEESQHQCQEMLQERDECEVEVKNVIFKNTSLKRELVVLSQQYQDVVDERDQLRVVTDGFHNCSELYEEALGKVRDLQDELAHANSLIQTLKKEQACTQVQETCHLYNELIKSSYNPHPITTIDLTEDSLLNETNKYKFSHKNQKKYAKLNKIIKKYNKYRKHHKLFIKNIPLRKERVDLLNKLNNYQIKLEDSIKIYETDTQRLQTDIQVLEDRLGSLYSKYVRSQLQIKEHILAANELVMCQCNCQRISNLKAAQPEATEDPAQAERVSQDGVFDQDITDSAQDVSQVDRPETASFSTSSNSNSHHGFHSVMFSDGIGKGLGKLLNSKQSQSTLNYCMPGLSYKHMMESVTNKVYNPDTNVTVFIGNSLNVKKNDITECVTELIKLSCNKIILCAFPYLEKLSRRQNNYIHMLNMHVHFLASHYSEKLVFFDTNNFVGKLKSTGDTVYLPIRVRRQIARLLSFTLNSDINSMSKSCTVVDISRTTNLQVVNTVNNVSTTAINIYNLN